MKQLYPTRLFTSPLFTFRLFTTAALIGCLLLTVNEPLRAAEALFNDQTLVLSAEDLNNGQQRLSEALAAEVPSLTSPLFANRGASAHARVVIDRGLSPDQLLILVNGERRYKSAISHITDTPAQGSLAVDLDAIPLAAVDRVEITRAVGSIQHGSAGAGGVLNVILKKRDSGGQLYADFAQHTTEITDVADVVAADIGPGFIGLTTAGDRNPDDGDGDTLRIGGSWGFKIGDEGSLTAAASFMDRGRTGREGFSRGQLFPLQADGSFDQREVTTDRLLQKFGDANVQELNFSFAFEQQVHGLTFNAFGAYAARTAKTFDAYTRPVAAPISLAAYPEGFLPERTSDSDGLAITLQLEGDNFGWNWLATYHQGGDELDRSLQGSINLSLDDAATSNTIMDFLIGNNESGIQETSLKANRLINLPFATANRIEIGLDNQLSDHEIERGDQAAFLAGGGTDALGQLQQAGSQQVIGIRPRNEFDEGRSALAAYAELQSDWQDEGLSTRIGLRYNDYDDIGTQVDASAGLFWQPRSDLHVTLDVTRGHRAPDIGQRFYEGTFVRYFDQELTRVEVISVESELGQTLAAAVPDQLDLGELDAETSLSANIAAVWQLSDAWRINAAVGYLDVDDRVLLSDALESAAIDTAFATNGVEAERATFYTNGADTKTISLDVGTSYRLTLPGSHLDFRLDASLYDTDASSNTQAVGRRVLQRLEEGGPGTKVHFEANWQRPKTSLAFRATYYGESTHPGDTAEEDHENGTGLLLDLILRYQINDTLHASVGGLNLFDAFPDVFDENTPLSPNGFEIPFSSYSPWGFNGRSVFLALRAEIP